MEIKMDDSRITTLQQVEEFINVSQPLYRMVSRSEAYQWTEHTLRKFGYLRLSRRQKGVLRKYLHIMTGYSDSQIDRLILRYRKTGTVRLLQYLRHQFVPVYSPEDIRLLAVTDDVHNYPSGQALKKTLEREYGLFGKKEYGKISGISVSHIYNIRKTTMYKRIAKKYIPTRPTVSVSIGERRKPDPQGKPGYIRVDTVHQGDKDEKKGLYHINTVDEVIQFEVISATSKISETYLLPLLELMLDTYPYRIQEFHPDNGSEYIVKTPILDSVSLS